jgi:hypothetical protein
MSESFQIYVSSKNGDLYKNNLLNNVEFYLPMIEIDDLYHIYMSVTNASIPVSWYNINLNNNVLVYGIVGGSTYNISLPVGNYNVTTLLSKLISVMPNFNITYSSLTNKFTFTHVSLDFVFHSSSSNCFSILGFTKYDQYSISRVLTSVNCINLSPVRSFIIGTSLRTGNINLADPLVQNILCSIPIISNSLGVVNYVNSDNFRTNLSTNVLNSLSIHITDQDANNIDFNGVNWFITLQLDIIKYID